MNGPPLKTTRHSVISELWDVVIAPFPFARNVQSGPLFRDDHVFTLTHKVTCDICESQYVTRKNNESMNLLTAKQTAQKLGVTLGTLYRMVRAGVIPTVRIGTGRSLRFDFEEVKSALTRSPSAPSSPQKAKDDPLFNLPKLAIETGIKDLAQHHDHYLYGIPIKPAVSPSRR